MASTLVGLFDDREAAQNAVSDLISAGVSRDKISVVANDGSGGTATHEIDEHGNLAGAGAASGAKSGAVVGGAAGLLIGLGFTVLPFAGFLLAGPIAGLLTGALAGAATGGVVGGLVGLGIPKEHAELYAEGIRRGGTLVTVQVADADESRIRDILDRDGAADIEERAASWRREGFTGYDPSAKPLTAPEATADRGRYATSATGEKLEVVEERLAVGKREVERGGVRIRSFVTEKPVSEQVTLHEEHVDIQRTPVDRPATGDVFREATIEMRETAEVPVVAKEAHVVEEISLNKTATDRVETVTDTVRRQDVEVENIGVEGDADYRNHFQTLRTNDRYERYAPAYQYGRSLANDRTTGGDWSTNESAYRSRWEEKNPGTWDEFKASVRHAYDRARSAVTGGSDSQATLR